MDEDRYWPETDPRKLLPFTKVIGAVDTPICYDKDDENDSAEI